MLHENPVKERSRELIIFPLICGYFVSARCAHLNKNNLKGGRSKHLSFNAVRNIYLSRSKAEQE